MARAAVLRWINGKLIAKFCVVFTLFFGLAIKLPSKVGDQRRVSKMWFGIPVALQTPAHRKLFFLPNFFHEINSPVTRDARDPSVHVSGVIEV